MQFQDLYHVFGFLYVPANSKEIILWRDILFQKMLVSAFLLRLEANYVEKMCVYPQFSGAKTFVFSRHCS